MGPDTGGPGRPGYRHIDLPQLAMRGFAGATGLLDHNTVPDRFYQIDVVRQVKAERRLEDARLVLAVPAVGVQAVSGKFLRLDYRNVRVLQNRHDTALSGFSPDGNAARLGAHCPHKPLGSPWKRSDAFGVGRYPPTPGSPS